MFDPAQPANHSALSSAVMRSQLTSLKALIDAVPNITSVVIDGVTTLPPGDPASVTASIIGTVLHLSFGIPEGEQGPAGAVGGDGPQGPPGPAGPPGEVTTTDLNNAITASETAMTANSSANSNAVSTLDTPFPDPDSEALRVAFNGLVGVLRRL